MDLKEQDVLYVKLVRVPTFEKMCCYLGSEDDLKYIEKRLAKIHETGFQLSRQSFDEKSGRFVFAKFKNRFWRGEVIQKLEDGIYCVKLPDLGLFVKFHKSRLVNDSNPVRVRDFYPLAFCSQTYFEDSLGNDPRKLIDTKRRLNGLIENGLPALPCQIHKINHQKFLLKICLYKKTGESFQPRSTFFKLLLQHPTADLQFFKHEYNFLHPAIVLREAKKCLSNNHLSIYSSDINNNNPELYVAPRKTSPLAVVTIHNEYEMTAKHSTNSVNTVESSTTASSTSRKRDSLPLGDENAHSNIEDVDSGGDSPDNAPPGMIFSPMKRRLGTFCQPTFLKKAEFCSDRTKIDFSHKTLFNRVFFASKMCQMLQNVWIVQISSSYIK